jgi:hypothetical protein
MRHCIICNERIEPPRNSTRRVRRDKCCCSATCRKRLQRRKAAGHKLQTDLPGQLILPLATNTLPSVEQFTPNRQLQDTPGSTIDHLYEL